MTPIITNDIVKECWNLLSVFEDENYIKSKIKERSSDIKPEKLNQVSNRIKLHMKQAEELYYSSNTSIITSPLTLFYSLNNFAKALCLYSQPTCEPQNSHGLKINISTPHDKQSVGDIVVRVLGNGTFVNFNSVLNDDIRENDTICLKAFFSLIPELKDIYYAVYSEEPNVFLLQQRELHPYSYAMQIISNSEKVFENKNLTLPSENDCYIEYGTGYDGVYANFSISMAGQDKKGNYLCRDIYSNTYLTLGIDFGDRTSNIKQINLLYMILYAFSMCARYYPDVWIHVINTKEKAIITKSIEICKTKFLIDILGLFNSTEYQFVTKVPDVHEEMSISDLSREILEEIKKEEWRRGKSFIK